MFIFTFLISMFLFSSFKIFAFFRFTNDFVEIWTKTDENPFTGSRIYFYKFVCFSLAFSKLSFPKFSLLCEGKLLLTCVGGMVGGSVGKPSPGVFHLWMNIFRFSTPAFFTSSKKLDEKCVCINMKLLGFTRSEEF